MERWQFIRWGIAASAVAHILVAIAIFLSTDVRTYDQAAPDQIPVDIVSDEPEKTPEPTPTPTPSATPSPDLTLPNPAASPSSQSAPSQQPAQSQPSAQPQPQPTLKETVKPQKAASPQTPSQPQPQPQSPARSASPEPQPHAQTYVPAQPDLTVKYGVRLGLPGALPPLAKSADIHDDDKDAGADRKSVV